jgi:hypothetical protein
MSKKTLHEHVQGSRRSVPKIPRNPADSPDVLTLGTTAIEAAVAHYWDALNRLRDGYARSNAADAAMEASGVDTAIRSPAVDRWESWTNAMHGEWSRAAETLIEMIVTWHGRSWLETRAIKTPQTPKAVIVGGKAYIATPDPTDLFGDELDVPAKESKTIHMMHLVIMDAAAIADLDAVEGGAL